MDVDHDGSGCSFDHPFCIDRWVTLACFQQSGLQAGILERSELRSAEQEDEDQRRQMTAEAATGSDSQPAAGRAQDRQQPARGKPPAAGPPAEQAAAAAAEAAADSPEATGNDSQSEWLPPGRRYTGATLRMLNMKLHQKRSFAEHAEQQAV